jgi:hypothetical protein
MPTTVALRFYDRRYIKANKEAPRRLVVEPE